MRVESLNYLFDCSIWLLFPGDQIVLLCDSSTRPWRRHTSCNLDVNNRALYAVTVVLLGKNPYTCLFLREQWVTLILHQPYIKLTLHHPIKPPTFQIGLHFKLKIESPTSVSAAHHLWRSEPDLLSLKCYYLVGIHNNKAQYVCNNSCNKSQSGSFINTNEGNKNNRSTDTVREDDFILKCWCN